MQNSVRPQNKHKVYEANTGCWCLVTAQQQWRLLASASCKRNWTKQDKQKPVKHFPSTCWGRLTWLIPVKLVESKWCEIHLKLQSISTTSYHLFWPVNFLTGNNRGSAKCGIVGNVVPPLFTFIRFSSLILDWWNWDLKLELIFFMYAVMISFSVSITMLLLSCIFFCIILQSVLRAI